MSTMSGVFPNALTPTFGSNIDPEAQVRSRRQNQEAAFPPVDEAERISPSQRSSVEQPGRLQADQSVEVAGRLAAPLGHTSGSAKPEQVEASPAGTTEESDSDIEREAASKQAKAEAEEQAKLEKDIELIRELAARDREVKAHEQAHQSVGGQYAGSMTFTYQQGPDGKRYAVGGEVSIDVSEVQGDPSATIEKAERIRRAALAPAEPSPQDRQVAALASQMSIEAQIDLQRIEREGAEKIVEDSEEFSVIAEDEEKQAEASSAKEEEDTERAADESKDRINDMLKKTSDTVVNALDAAYRIAPIKEVGFNLDTTV